MKRIVLLTLACAAAGSMFGVDIYIWPLDLAPEDKRPSYYVLVPLDQYISRAPNVGHLTIGSYLDSGDYLDWMKIPNRDTFGEKVDRIPLLLPSPKMFKESDGDDVCKDYSRVVTKNEIVVPEGQTISSKLVIIFNDKGYRLDYYSTRGNKPLAIWCMLLKLPSGAAVSFSAFGSERSLSDYFDSYYYDLGQKCLEVRGKNKAQALAIRAKWKLSSISLDSILKKARKAGQEVQKASAEGLSVLKDIAIIVPVSAAVATSLVLAVPAAALGLHGGSLAINYSEILRSTVNTASDVVDFTVDMGRVAAAAAKAKLSVAKEKLSGAVDTAKEKLSGAADAAKEKLSGAADAAKEKFASLKERLNK